MHKQAPQKKQHKLKKIVAPKKVKKVVKSLKTQSTRTLTTTSLQTITAPALKQSFKPLAMTKFSNTSPISNKLHFTPITLSKRFGGWGYSHFLPADEVETRVMGLLSNLPAIDMTKLTPKSRFDELGLDSLQQVELIIMLEQDFEVEINDDDATRIQTVPEAVHYFSHTPYCV